MGGFGRVWRTVQDRPVRWEVALKILNKRMDSREVLELFGRERQIFASLDHPGIATLFDAGLTVSGRPYSAMGLARSAVPVTVFCRGHALDLTERMRLFGRICGAVGFSGGTLTVQLNAPAPWTSQIDSPFLSLEVDNGSGNVTIKVTATPNPSHSARTRTVMIDGVAYSVTQAGLPAARATGGARAAVRGGVNVRNLRRKTTVVRMTALDFSGAGRPS